MRTDSNLARGLTVVGGLAIFLALMPGARSERGGVIDLAELEHLRQHPEDQPWVEDYRLVHQFFWRLAILPNKELKT